MQLKRDKIVGLLASATCGLLSASVEAAEDKRWHVESAVLVYQEKDRVDAVEPTIHATRTFDNGSKLRLTGVFDSLTGASPNGATPTDTPQTFTRPSGNGSYITPSGDIPLDDTFKDSRTAFSVNYEYPLDRVTRVSGGFVGSSEYDYISTAVNFSLARDFNQKNTTVSLGVAYASDSIEPEGGIPTPFASMTPAGEAPTRMGSEDDKTVTDFMIGVTQIINRQTVMQLNYGYSSSEGYLNDPFKLVSVVDGSSGQTQDYLFENRPDSRVSNNIYWKTKYHSDGGDTIDFSYRYLWDDWEITSHTFDLRYRWRISDRHYLEPHLRYYVQDEADFYQHSLVDGVALPSEASADSRLGSFSAITYGAKYGFKLSPNQEISLRLEFYEQNGDTVGTAIGVQNNYDLFPDLEATIIQLGYSIDF